MTRRDMFKRLLACAVVAPLAAADAQPAVIHVRFKDMSNDDMARLRRKMAAHFRGIGHSPFVILKPGLTISKV